MHLQRLLQCGVRGGGLSRGLLQGGLVGGHPLGGSLPGAGGLVGLGQLPLQVLRRLGRLSRRLPRRPLQPPQQ